MPLRLLVGLGNPGATYDGTRHNLGAAFVTALATQHRVTLRSQPRFKGQLGQLRVDKHELLLFIPTTFMNESGQAVAPLLRYHRLPIADMLVAHDELDLPPGAARLKRGGGAAGHNGLRDLIRALGGCADFARLRLGIGHPGHRSAVTRYVLGRAPSAERELCAVALVAATAVLPVLLHDDWGRATTQLHTATRTAADSGHAEDADENPRSDANS